MLFMPAYCCIPRVKVEKEDRHRKRQEVISTEGSRAREEPETAIANSGEMLDGGASESYRDRSE